MLAHRRFVSMLLLVVLVLTALSPEAVTAKYSPSTDIVSADPGVMERLAQQARQSGSARVIVRLNVAYQPEGKLAGPQAIKSQRDAIKGTQDKLLGRLVAQRHSGVKRFRFVPYIALAVDEQGLAALKTMPEVVSIEEDNPVPPLLAESVPLIGATPVKTGGYTGQGQTVAILDTGVDKTHPFLAGKVVSEACYSTNSGYPSSSLCPGGVDASTEVGSGVNCTYTNIPECAHGTHVAGIAAGKGASFSGVAPDASIISIQVFSLVTGSACGGMAWTCLSSFASDEVLALERVYELSSQYNIAAVNFSLGSGQNLSYCDVAHQFMTLAIDNLRSVGIATVAASGNEGASNGISWPACVSEAVSVGSTLDGSSGATPADTVSTFSNSYSVLSLLAPGQSINSSVPGGGYAAYQGTSMAAPHVTGAWAVIKSKYPTATVDQVLTTLINTGVPVKDPRNLVTKPRIQVDAALNRLWDGAPILKGFSPYTGPVGTQVDIYGLNFNSTSGVTFGNLPAASYKIVSPTQIQAVVPFGAVTAPITVYTPAGIGASPSSFQVGEKTLVFTNPYMPFDQTVGSALGWVDYDNDGIMDVMLTGLSAAKGERISRLYKGLGNFRYSLVTPSSPLPGAAQGSVTWGDVDNDGYLDLLLTGSAQKGYDTDVHLLNNVNGTLDTSRYLGYSITTNGAARLADIDLDGDLDIILSGLLSYSNTEETRIYQNDGPRKFSWLSPSLTGVIRGSLNTVDYDNDGDLDLFLTGLKSGAPLMKLYRGDGSGSFTDTNTNLTAVYDSSSDWGDYDADGDLDLLLSGLSSVGRSRRFTATMARAFSTNCPRIFRGPAPAQSPGPTPIMTATWISSWPAMTEMCRLPRSIKTTRGSFTGHLSPWPG